MSSCQYNLDIGSDYKKEREQQLLIKSKEGNMFVNTGA
jgi:hypothetical protein